MKQLRGPKHENWPVCDPRAAPPGECGLKSGENGHQARANEAIDGPLAHIAHQSGWSGWWVWGWSYSRLQRPHAARGALLQFECLRKTHGIQAGPEGLAGMAELRPLFPGRPGEKSRCFLQPTSPARCARRAKSLVVCARDQVVVARPPVLTPPWRYWCSLVCCE
jgi:hypothetical protein